MSIDMEFNREICGLCDAEMWLCDCMGPWSEETKSLVLAAPEMLKTFRALAANDPNNTTFKRMIEKAEGKKS